MKGNQKVKYGSGRIRSGRTLRSLINCIPFLNSLLQWRVDLYKEYPIIILDSKYKWHARLPLIKYILKNLEEESLEQIDEVHKSQSSLHESVNQTQPKISSIGAPYLAKDILDELWIRWIKLAPKWSALFWPIIDQIISGKASRIRFRKSTTNKVLLCQKYFHRQVPLPIQRQKPCIVGIITNKVA